MSTVLKLLIFNLSYSWSVTSATLVCLFTQMETNDKKLILKDSIFIMNLFGTLKKKN